MLLLTILLTMKTRPWQHLGKSRAVCFASWFGWWWWWWGIWVVGFDHSAVEVFLNNGGFANALTIAEVKVSQQQMAVFSQQQVLG